MNEVPNEIEIGKIDHYFSHLSVAGATLSDDLKIGDEIHIKGHTTDFSQKVESIQIEHESVEEAKKGDSIGLKVKDHVREHDVIYKIQK